MISIQKPQNTEVQAELDAVLRDVAHQWRQPLAKINSSVFEIDTVLSELNIQNDSLEEKLAEIESLTKYMSETLNDFLNNTKKNIDNVFSLNELLQQVQEVVKGVLREHKIVLNLQIEKEFVLSGNGALFKQVLISLLNNAKDIFVERNVYDAKIDISAVQNKGYCLLRVTDNGGGMTKSAMKKAFNADYSTKHDSEGSGIGLNMAKKIIEENFKGALNVKNLNEGSCFEIQLQIL